MKYSITFKRIAQLSATCLLLLLLLSMVACSKETKQETLLIGGSTTMLPYIAKLKERFVKINPNILVASDGGGSTIGIAAVKRNVIDMATMSREVKTDEDDLYVKDYLVGKDALVIVVHPSNPVVNITQEQTRDVFMGVITNWRQLGGADAPIVLIGRNKESSTRKSMDEMVLDSMDYAKWITADPSAESLAETVAGNPNAIGYLTIADVTPNVKSLDINGVVASRENVLSGCYVLSRSFYFVFYDKPKSAAQKFLDFTLSKEGQEILEKNGIMKINQ